MTAKAAIAAEQARWKSELKAGAKLPTEGKPMPKLRTKKRK